MCTCLSCHHSSSQFCDRRRELIDTCASAEHLLEDEYGGTWFCTYTTVTAHATDAVGAIAGRTCTGSHLKQRLEDGLEEVLLISFDDEGWFR